MEILALQNRSIQESPIHQNSERRHQSLSLGRNRADDTETLPSKRGIVRTTGDFTIETVKVESTNRITGFFLWIVLAFAVLPLKLYKVNSYVQP